MSQIQSVKPIKLTKYRGVYVFMLCFTLTSDKWCMNGSDNIFYHLYVWLTLYQTENFRIFQTERVCRRQFQIWRK